MMNKNILRNNGYMSLQRFNEGVQLVEQQSGTRISKNNLKLEYIINAPFDTYFIDEDGHIRGINQSGIILTRLSERDAIGLSAKKVIQQDSYLKLRYHDKKVMYSGCNMSYEHFVMWKDGHCTSWFDYKFPWYNQQNKVIGIFGICLDSTDSKITDILKQSFDFFVMNLLGFKNFTNNISSSYINGISLTKRETDCAKLLMQGFTAKMIGSALNISHRTVEHYIENLKVKLKAVTKFQLIDILHSYFE